MFRVWLLKEYWTPIECSNGEFSIHVSTWWFCSNALIISTWEYTSGTNYKQIDNSYEDNCTLDFRLSKESIAETAHVVGSLERVWSNSTLLTKEQLATLPRHHEKMWVFRRCIIDGVLFHSRSYKRVIARNDYTVEFQHLENTHYGSIHTYAKVEEKCLRAVCSDKKCFCDLPCHYFAIVEVLEKDDEQLPSYRGRTVVSHITRVKSSNRYMMYMMCLPINVHCYLYNLLTV